MRRLLPLLSAVLISSTIAACGADEADVMSTQPAAVSSSPAAPAETSPVATVAPNGQSVEVQSLDNSFRPQELTIEAGTEVVFVNVGRNDHNVRPEPDSIQGWGVGEAEFAPGDEYRHVFGAPGVYAYVCTIHGVNGKGMVGTITVTG